MVENLPKEIYIFKYGNNKKAFQYDAYRPLRWPPLDVSTGGVYLTPPKGPGLRDT